MKVLSALLAVAVPVASAPSKGALCSAGGLAGVNFPAVGDRSIRRQDFEGGSNILRPFPGKALSNPETGNVCGTS